MPKARLYNEKGSKMNKSSFINFTLFAGLRGAKVENLWTFDSYK